MRLKRLVEAGSPGALHGVGVEGAALQRAPLPRELAGGGSPADDGPGGEKVPAHTAGAAPAYLTMLLLIRISVYHSNLRSLFLVNFVNHGLPLANLLVEEAVYPVAAPVHAALHHLLDVLTGVVARVPGVVPT